MYICIGQAKGISEEMEDVAITLTIKIEAKI